MEMTVPIYLARLTVVVAEINGITLIVNALRPLPDANLLEIPETIYPKLPSHETGRANIAQLYWTYLVGALHKCYSNKDFVA